MDQGRQKPSSDAAEHPSEPLKADSYEAVEEAAVALSLDAAPSPVVELKDHLSTALPDVLEYMFELLHLDQQRKTTKDPICKALLPYQRANLYRQVELEEASLSLFAQALSSNEILGSIVQELTVPAHVKAGLSTEEVGQLLRSLSNLGKLKAPHWLKLIANINQELVFPRLSRLESFYLHIDYKVLPSDPLRHFPLLPALRDLYIVFVDGSLSLEINGERTSTQSPLPSIENLLAGSHLGRAEVVELISRFTNLKSLFLCANLASPNLGPLLQRTTTNLEALTIRFEFDGADEVDVPDPITLLLTASLGGDEIPRFTHLRTLTLMTPFLSPSFYSALRYPFPVEQLTFAEQSLPIVELLFPAISGPDSLRSLQKIALYVDQIRARQGRPVRPSDIEAIDRWMASARTDANAEGEDDPPPPPVEGWLLPRWMLAYSLSSTQQLIRLASCSGVQLEGTLVRAAEVEEMWERQLEAARKGELVEEVEERRVGGAEGGRYGVGLRGEVVLEGR